MGYSLELYFEFRFEEKIRALWGALEKAGVPSLLHKIGSRPHLSLVVLDDCMANQAAELMESGIRRYSVFPITFSAIALIPGKQQAVFLVPAMSSFLLEIQRDLYHLLQKGGYPIREHYEPHKWLPHCSISKELSSPEALATIEVCQRHSAIGSTMVTEVGFIEFRPRKEIRLFGLSKG